MTSTQHNIPRSREDRYSLGCSWATGWTVIPGDDGEDKKPLVGFKAFTGEGSRRPYAREKDDWAEKGAQGARPLLLLDHPTKPELSLVCIDVDHMPSAYLVVDALKASGVGQTLVCSTGRVGGGRHYYFRREPGKEHLYRSQNSAKAFPEKAVDMKATRSYVVCPLARHSTGKIYTPSFKGEEVASLASIFYEIPVLPLELWLKFQGKTVEKPQGPRVAPTPVVGDTPEWVAVIRDGRDRQPCPWCARGGDRVLSYDPEKASARCWREEVTRVRVMTPKEVEEALEPVEEAIKELPVAREREVDPEDLLRWKVNELFYQALDAKDSACRGEDPDGFVLFSEEDPLYEQEVSAAASLKALADSWAYDGLAPLCCSRGGPKALIAGKSDSGGFVKVIDTSCWSFTCSECGSRLLAALGSALRGKVWEMTEGQRAFSLMSYQGNIRLNAREWSGSSIKRLSRDHNSYRKVLNRWGNDHPDDFEWVGIQINSEEVVYLTYSRGEARHPDFKTSGPPEEVTEAALSLVDLEEWRRAYQAAAEAGVTLRVRILIGPSKLTKVVNALADYLTGHHRRGLISARKAMAGRHEGPAKDPDEFKAVVTFRTKDFINYLSDLLLTDLTLKEEEGARWDGRKVLSVKIPVNPVPILAECEENGIVVPARPKPILPPATTYTDLTLG